MEDEKGFEFNTLGASQNDCRFTDKTGKCIFIKKQLVFWLKFVSVGLIDKKNDKVWTGVVNCFLL